MADYLGRRCRLLRDTQTNGGVKFKKGSIMVVTSHWRGRLHLTSEVTNQEIRQVARSAVELIEGPRVVFLDIDGVLNSMQYFQRRPKNEGGKEWREFYDIDDEAVKIVNEILRLAEAKVVVSSTWRHGRTQDELQTLLNRRGFEGEIIGITPWHYTDKYRGNEIQAWLDENPCSAFIIIDDDSDMLHLMPKLVKTRFHEGGITEEHVDEALRLFGLR